MPIIKYSFHFNLLKLSEMFVKISLFLLFAGVGGGLPRRVM